MGRLRHYRGRPWPALPGGGRHAFALCPAAGRRCHCASWRLLLALVGAGVGTVLPVTTVAIQNAVPMHQLGTATGVMSFFRSLGGAIAVAGFGALVAGRRPITAGGAPAGGTPTCRARACVP